MVCLFSVDPSSKLSLVELVHLSKPKSHFKCRHFSLDDFQPTFLYPEEDQASRSGNVYPETTISHERTQGPLLPHDLHR